MRRLGLADVGVDELGGDVKIGTTLSGALMRGVVETAGNIVGRIGAGVGARTGAGVVDEVAGVTGAAVLGSSLRHLITTGAVIRHTGKSPGFKLQLGLVAISDDSTSCLLGFMVDLYTTSAFLRSN